MVFGLFELVWIISATAGLMLILPAALLILREYYLDRNLKIQLLWIPAITTLFVFIYLLAISGKPVAGASVEAGKILVSGIVLIQLTHALFENAASYRIPHLGTLFLLTQRCTVLEKKIMANAFYSFRVRRAYGKKGHGELRGLVLGLVLTATSEFLRLADEIYRLYRNRGSKSATKGWVVPKMREIPIIVGDIILLMMIGLLLHLELRELTPARVLDFYNLVFP